MIENLTTGHRRLIWGLTNKHPQRVGASTSEKCHSTVSTLHAPLDNCIRIPGLVFNKVVTEFTASVRTVMLAARTANASNPS